MRHGESTANVAREQAEADGVEVIEVGQRDADVPLSDRGVRQSRALGEWIAADPSRRPDAVWSSPYERARQTADVTLVTADLDLVVRLDERLRDKELGVLDTLTSRGVRTRFPEEAERRRWLGKFYYRAPGGESWADVALRLRSALADIERISHGRVLVVAHDAVVLLFRYICEELTEREVMTLARSSVDNAAVTRLVRDEAGHWRAVDVNLRDHLPESLRTEHPGEPVMPA